MAREELASRNPLAPGLVDEVRGWTLEFVAERGGPEQDYPQELLAALWGVRLTPTVNDKFRPLLEGAGGQGKVWLVLSPPAGAVPRGSRWSSRRNPAAAWRT